MNSLPTPLTISQIEAERAEAASAIRKMGQYKKLSSIIVVCFALAITGYLIMRLQDFSSDPALAVVVVVMVALAAALEFDGAFLFGFAAVFAGALMVVATGKNAAEDMADIAAVFAVVVAGGLVGAVAGALSGSFRLYLERIESVIKSSTDRIAMLADLDATATNSCVQYLAWCESDPDLRCYQDAIGSMARLPTLLDFNTAKDWINTAQKRHTDAQKRHTDAQKTMAAQEACKRLAGWDELTNAVR